MRLDKITEKISLKGISPNLRGGYLELITGCYLRGETREQAAQVSRIKIKGIRSIYSKLSKIVNPKELLEVEGLFKKTYNELSKRHSGIEHKFTNPLCFDVSEEGKKHFVSYTGFSHFKIDDGDWLVSNGMIELKNTFKGLAKYKSNFLLIFVTYKGEVEEEFKDRSNSSLDNSLLLGLSDGSIKTGRGKLKDLVSETLSKSMHKFNIEYKIDGRIRYKPEAVIFLADTIDESIKKFSKV